jgi:pimeloyl-ACP methyl ester carboxylesterase
MSIESDTEGFEHRYVDTNGIKLHVVVGGSGPLIVLLHGWPEHWATWRHVMKPLRDAGFTVAAPDLRGFNLSDKPKAVSAYSLDFVIEDVAGLIKALGHERAHVVGHDWGGATAWHLAQHRDDVVDKLVIVSCPHPKLFEKRLRSSLEQLRASYYMFVFQLPRLPERMISRDDFRPIRGIMRHQPRRQGAFDDEDMRAYRDALAQPGALTAGLNYYRASFREALRGRRPKSPTFKRVVERPTLVLWAMNDEALPPGNLDGLESLVRELRLVKIDDCSHWVQHDKPDVIVAETLRHIQG